MHKKNSKMTTFNSKFIAEKIKECSQCLSDEDTLDFINAQELKMDEFTKYQKLMGNIILEYNQKISDYEKQLNIFNSIVEMNKYLNKIQMSPDLFEIVNDMIIRIAGVNTSTIALLTNRKITVIASNKHKKGKIFIGSENNDNSITTYIKNDTETLGLIEIEFTYKHEINNYIRKFLDLICSQLLLILDNRRLYEKAKIQANTDMLTACCNRKYFFDTMDLKRVDERGYCILMIDIDKFKDINDAHGHDAGDIVLRTLGRILLSNFRKDDLVCRYGGEEFLIFIHGINDKNMATLKAEILRTIVETKEIKYEDNIIKLTISIGIGMYCADNKELPNIIKTADKNLYISKNSGRNKTTV